MNLMTRFSLRVVAAAAVVAVALSAAPAALGQAQIKVNDNVNIKFGILLQPQVDWLSSPTVDGSYSQNLQVRRLRLVVGGQVAKNVFFYLDTENSRLGGTSGTTTGTKVISTGFQVLTAVAEWRIAKEFNLQGGLILVPQSREALKSSSNYFFLDSDPYAYTQTTALGGTGGRDAGFQLRGYFVDDRLEYRFGAFQGNRNASSSTNAASNNSFRYMGRLQYNFLDTEVYNMPSYGGGYLGTKKILALGASYDTQSDYSGYTFDLCADLPTSFGSVMSTLQYTHADGGVYLPALPKEDWYQAELALYAKSVKVGPYFRFDRRNYAAPNNPKNESRYAVGLGWFPYGYNFNVKAGWAHLEPNTGLTQNQFTVQFQVFYF